MQNDPTNAFHDVSGTQAVCANFFGLGDLSPVQLARSQSLQMSPAPGITASAPNASPSPSSSLHQLAISMYNYGLHGLPSFDPQLAPPRTRRSQSMAGHPPVTDEFIHMQRQNTYSHGPIVPTTSTRSGSGNIPFTAVGPIGFPINAGNGLADALMGPNEASSSSSSFSSSLSSSVPVVSAMANPRQRRRSELSTLHEHIMPDVGEDVDAFLARHKSYKEPLAFTSPTIPHFSCDALTPSTCPSMVSGPSAAEDGTMSRVNSSFDNISDSIAMSRDGSAFTNFSMGASFDMSRLDSTRSQYIVPRPVVPSPKGLSIDGLFAGVGASLPPSGDAIMYSGSFPMPSMQSLPMQRSISCASAKSTTLCLEERAKEATQRHIMNAKTEIRPKAAAAETVPCPPVQSCRAAVSVSPPQPAHISSRSWPQTTSKASTKRPKIMCSQCEEQPEGFRGEHELRRHIASKHTAQAKRWVCRDPREAGIATALKPIKPLSKCKYCLEGKQYNIDYNAAAHLRRIHFNPKTVRAKIKAKNNSSISNKNEARRGLVAISEKRGGKGGGDQPVIEDLRHWLVEITVDVQPREGSDETEDQDTEEAEEMMNVDGLADAAPAVGAPAVDFGQAAVYNPDMTQMPLDQFSGFEAGPFPIEPCLFGDIDFNYGLSSSMSDSVATLTPNMFAGFST